MEIDQEKPAGWRSRRKASRMLREVGTVLKRRGSRLKPSARAELEARLDDLKKVLDDDPTEASLKAAADALSREVSRHSKELRSATIMEYVRSLGLAIALALLIRAFVVEAFEIPTGSMIPTLLVDDHIFVNKFIYGLRVPFTHFHLMEVDGPHRGDVAVFEFPGGGEDKGKDFIKRIIGLPGDRVRLVDNVLLINGEPVATRVLATGISCGDATLTLCRCVRQEERLGEVTYVTQHLDPESRRSAPGCFNLPDWPTDDPRQFGNKGTNGDFPDVVVPSGHVLVMGDNRDNSSDGRYWGFVPIENLKGKAMIIWWPPGRFLKPVH